MDPSRLSRHRKTQRTHGRGQLRRSWETWNWAGAKQRARHKIGWCGGVSAASCAPAGVERQRRRIDWLTKNDCHWSFDRGTIKIRGNWTSICSHVYVDEDVEVLPSSRVEVPVRMTHYDLNTPTTHWIVERKRLRPRIYTACTVYTCGQPEQANCVGRQCFFVFIPCGSWQVIQRGFSCSYLRFGSGWWLICMQVRLGWLTGQQGVLHTGVDKRLCRTMIVPCCTYGWINAWWINGSGTRRSHQLCAQLFTRIVEERVWYWVYLSDSTPNRHWTQQAVLAAITSVTTHILHLEYIDSQVDEMVRHDITEPTASPWASNVVLARKSDGTLKFCIDYRQLNAMTYQDSYPLPRIDTCLDALGGSSYFLTTDLRSGFWQMVLDPNNADKTAFITQRGQLRFKVL